MSLFGFACALTAICGIWMLVRIWRGSPGLAILSLVFLPAAVIPLVQNWGEDDLDIKVPFLLTLASSVFLSYAMNKAASIAVGQQQSINWLAQYFA